MAKYREEYYQQVSVAEFRRELRMECIERAFETLNREAWFAFKDEKEEVFEACRKEIRSKMDAVKEWYRLSRIIGNSTPREQTPGRTICTRSMTCKDQINNNILICKEPIFSKRKPKITSKPFVVYMLREEEILEDVQTIFNSMPQDTDD